MTAFGQYADDETANTMKQRDYKDATDLVVAIADDVTPKTNDNIAFTLSKTDHKCPQEVYGCTPTKLDRKVNTITKSYGAGGSDLETKPLILTNGTQDPITQDNQAFPLGRNHGQENVVFGRKPENGGNATEPMVNIAPCQTKTDKHAVAECIPLNSMTMLGRPSDDLKPHMGMGIGSPDDPQNILSCNHHHAAFFDGAVRRLTPIECERLQGFPDNHTKIPYRGKSAEYCPDGPRYAACGNSMAVPVMKWIGSRIDAAVTIA